MTPKQEHGARSHRYVHTPVCPLTRPDLLVLWGVWVSRRSRPVRFPGGWCLTDETAEVGGSDGREPTGDDSDINLAEADHRAASSRGHLRGDCRPPGTQRQHRQNVVPPRPYHP